MNAHPGLRDAVIAGYVRTPIGRYGGALASVRPDTLLAHAIKALLERTSIDPTDVDDVIAGCANQAGEDNRNVGRMASLLADLPVEVPGQTINRLCGSGLQAVNAAAQAIWSGQGEVFIAGGVESMTRAPFVVGKAEQPFAKDFKAFDSSLGARFPNPKLEGLFGADTMPQTADNLAREYQLKREDCDKFALASQQKYAKARQDGFFKSEIRPVSIPLGKGKPDAVVSEDEHPRPETTMEGLQKLKALFPDGVTTAGNASGINDGAAALIVASRVAGDSTGVKPLARIIATGVAGVPPRTMGYGPVPAARKALERAGLDLKDMDVIEINEAFAAQVLACLKGLGLAFDDARVNPNGGAIAVGHPLGASGTRLALTATRQLQRTGGRYALVSMCIGVGQGIAVILERV